MEESSSSVFSKEFVSSILILRVRLCYAIAILIIREKKEKILPVALFLILLEQL